MERRWPLAKSWTTCSGPRQPPGNYAQTVKELQNYLSQRNQWLYQTVLGWQEIPVSATFYDISPADWFATSVNYVVEEGLFAGTSPTSFSPYETMTRAMAVTVLYRLAGEPQVTETAQLSDVEPNSWYSQPWPGAWKPAWWRACPTAPSTPMTR